MLVSQCPRVRRDEPLLQSTKRGSSERLGRDGGLLGENMLGGTSVTLAQPEEAPECSHVSWEPHPTSNRSPAGQNIPRRKITPLKYIPNWRASPREAPCGDPTTGSKPRVPEHPRSPCLPVALLPQVGRGQPQPCAPTMRSARLEVCQKTEVIVGFGKLLHLAEPQCSRL